MRNNMKTKNYKLIEKAMHDFKTLYTDTENEFSVKENVYTENQQLVFIWHGTEKRLQIIFTCSKKKPSDNLYSVYLDNSKIFTIRNMPLHRVLDNVNDWLGNIRCMIEPLVIHC